MRDTSRTIFPVSLTIVLFALLITSSPEVFGEKAKIQKQADSKIRPFREIGVSSLGFRGDHYTYATAGIAIFDANGDGLLDIYLPQDGRPIGKATSGTGALTKKDFPALPSTLFLNQGIDSKGSPIYRAIEDLLVDASNKYLKEELLVENKYQPRDNLSEDEFRAGRIAYAAVAADFNGDGRIDLYVLNGHHGMPYQTKETGVPTYPVQDNLGRTTKVYKKPIIITTPPFLHTDMEDGLKTQVNFGSTQEWEGRNTLYLNKGDKDNDGIPEWEDITEQAGVGGRWDSNGATVADIDRDGDLDIYVANFLDPDFWGFGMNRFAGNRNQLYLNQLVETGELTFLDVALPMNVSGLHKEEGLPNGMYFPALGKMVNVSEQYVNGKRVGEESDHSAAAQLTDWNDDGWPDLIVANDIGGTRLRVYENIEGETFRRIKKFDEPKWEGGWMGVQSGDLDGDGQLDVVISNFGSQAMSIRNTALVIDTKEETNVQALAQINYLQGRSTYNHVLLTYDRNSGLKDITLETKVNHSSLIPPDTINKNNIMPVDRDFHQKMRYENSITGIEFSWGPVLFDVDNDSDLDIYLAGALARGNDGDAGDFSGNPGRLLVNQSLPGKFIFQDLTLEYRLLDIMHMEYDHWPPRRRSPGTGWHKRDYIYATDIDAISEMGLEASEKSAIHDIFRMHETAVGMMSGDLNNDGFNDLIVTHAGGYNSLSPNAKNLKVEINGQVRALPGTDKLRHPPTNYEPGKTFIYINGGAPKSEKANWIKLRLLDPNSKNRYAVGAKVTINNKIMRRITVGGTNVSAYSGDLHVGLGEEALKAIEIRWPSGSMKSQRIELEKPVSKRIICVERDKGVVSCPSDTGAMGAKRV